MSEAQSASESGATSSAGRLPMHDQPEAANVKVEEKNNRAGPVTVRYLYPAEEGDIVHWTMEDTEEGNVQIQFEVRRKESDAVKYFHRSRPLSLQDLKGKANLLCIKKKCDVKNGYYKVELKKLVDFKLEDYFYNRSPPLDL